MKSAVRCFSDRRQEGRTRAPGRRGSRQSATAIEAHLAAVEALTKFLDEIDGDHDMNGQSSAGFHLLDDDREEDAGEDDFLQRGVL